MSRADYAHWNEEADQVWWAEEGSHVVEYNPEPDDWEDESWRDEVPDEDDEDDEDASLDMQERFQAHYPDGITSSPDA